MTKRKASIALDDDNQSDHGHVDGLDSRGIVNFNNGASASSLTDNDNGNSNRPATNQMLTQNGSSSGIIDGRTVKIQPSSNQNDNSNSSNTATSVAVGGTNQQLNKSKKERADNWSSSEIQVLHRGIESRREIFYGPPSQATKKNRELAWEAITKEVNTVSTTPRTLGQVMKKFKNEKCRAKRKFAEPDKESHNNNQMVEGSTNNVNVSNSNGTNTTSNNVTVGLRAQQQTTNHNSASNNQHQQMTQHPTHLMTTTASAGSSGETMTAPQAASINVVKLAPQNVAKTMIDLPGHVQHTIQMPNDDMVLIVPPDMDGLLSGVNIVSDGNGHHHFQKCSSNTIGNHQHSHHNQHAIQTLSTNQGLMSGTINNGMMTRTIPAGSMCSLVYSAGNEVCGQEHHIATGPGSIAPNHLAVSAQNLVHHRPNLDQGQQQHQLHHTPQSTHQQHQQQHQQPQQHPQQQQHSHPQLQQHHHHHQQQQHAQTTHSQTHPIHHQHLTQNHLTPSSSTTASINATNSGGVAVESQLKNLLFNLLLKDGQHPSVPNTFSSNQDYSKQRNDMLAIIASTLAKIESHLSKISKVAGALMNQNTNLGESIRSQLAGQAQQMVNSSASVSTATNPGGDSASGGLTIASDNNNNSFNISNPGPASNITSNQRSND